MNLFFTYGNSSDALANEERPLPSCAGGDCGLSFFVLLSQSEGWSVAGNRQVVCNVTF